MIERKKQKPIRKKSPNKFFHIILTTYTLVFLDYIFKTYYKTFLVLYRKSSFLLSTTHLFYCAYCPSYCTLPRGDSSINYWLLNYLGLSVFFYINFTFFSVNSGHPACTFCDQRFLDDDFLYRHLRKDHYFCHFCDADGKIQFYE